MTYTFKINIILMIIFHYLSSSIYSSNIARIGKQFIPIIIIIIWIFQTILNQQKIKKIKFPLFILFSAFFFFTFISIFMSEDILLSIIEILGLISLFILSFYVVPKYIWTKKDYISFLNIFNWTLFILLIIGIILGYGNRGLTFTDFHNRIRYKSILENANSLGSYTMLGSISSILLIYFKRKKKYIIPLIVNGIVLVLTDSRTAIFTLISFFVIFLYSYFYNKNKNIKKIVKPLIIISFCILVLITMFSIDKLANISMSKINETLSGRIDSWISPFQGTDYIKIIFGRGSFSHYENPHNYYIKSILSWGIFGTSIFFLITIVIIINIFKKVKHGRDNIYFKEINYISLALLFTFLGFSLFESMFFNIGNLASIFLWFNLGLSISGEEYE